MVQQTIHGGSCRRAAFWLWKNGFIYGYVYTSAAINSKFQSQLIYQLNGMQETFARAAYFESDKFYEYAVHDRAI
jgi:hypothetical protein